MYVITRIRRQRRAQWPTGANSGPSTPTFTCYCGAHSSSGSCPRGH
jgi:hypothetical protein